MAETSRAALPFWDTPPRESDFTLSNFLNGQGFTVESCSIVETQMSNEM
jgi:hypothetical protein